MIHAPVRVKVRLSREPARKLGPKRLWTARSFQVAVCDAFSLCVRETVERPRSGASSSARPRRAEPRTQAWQRQTEPECVGCGVIEPLRRHRVDGAARLAIAAPKNRPSEWTFACLGPCPPLYDQWLHAASFFSGLGRRPQEGLGGVSVSLRRSPPGLT